MVNSDKLGSTVDEQGGLAKTLKCHYHMHQYSTTTIHQTPVPYIHLTCSASVHAIGVESLHSLVVQKYIPPGRVMSGQGRHYPLECTKSATTT